MKKLTLLLVLLLGMATIYGQSHLEFAHDLEESGKGTYAYSGAYYGNMLMNPGAKFGVEYVLLEGKKLKRKGTRLITRQVLLNGDLGFYWDPKSHVGVFSTAGVILRRTSSRKNRTWDFKCNPLGVYRSFLPSTYEVIDGKVQKKVLAGSFQYAPSISLGFGRLRSGKRLHAHFININAMFLMPYNLILNPMLSVDFGYRFGGGRITKNYDKLNDEL